MAVALGLVIMAICFAVASRQWFFAEDFQYLGYVRGTFWFQPWTWWDVYLPRLPGFNWAYRPLSFETFYYLGNLAFGLQTFGYLAVSLVFHFASGALLWATALRLGLHRSASAFTALLSVSRLPSLAEIFFISISSYVFSKFWMLASLLLALHALRQERLTVRRAQCAAAAVATALALLSNELALATPAVVGAALVGDGRLGSRRVPWSRIVAQLLPHLVISAAWCVVRFGVIVLDPRPAVYGPSFGLRTVLNAVSLLGSTLGPGASEVLLLWLLVPAAILAARPALRALAGEWPLGAALVGLTWLGAMEAIFAPTLAYQIRFGIAAEVPVCLLIGVGASLAWRCAPPRAGAALGVAAMLSVVATFPYRALWSNWSSPRGDTVKAFVELVGRDPAPVGGTVVLLYHASLTASNPATNFLYSIKNGAALNAICPERRLTFDILDTRDLAQLEACSRCMYLAVRPDLSVEVVPDPAVAPPPNRARRAPGS
ncbi:MAG: hypothetical protein ACREI8_00635 [Myxococcota bacterium]